MIKIITDSSANLPEEIIKKYDIAVIPFHYTIDGKEYPAYEEGVGFNGKAFYDKMKEGMDVKTSMINSNSFKEFFKVYLADGIDVIYIGMSSGISGTYQSAYIAGVELTEEFPDRKIITVDTRAASLGEGIPVIKAARMNQDGKTFEEISSYIIPLCDRICQYFTVDDLRYLKKGGRISNAAAIVGGLLNINPILRGNDNGEIVLCKKVRGRKKAFDALVNKYQDLVAPDNDIITIAHGDCPEDAEILKNKLIECGFDKEFVINCYEPTTGSHVGPGTLAFFFIGTTR